MNFALILLLGSIVSKEQAVNLQSKLDSISAIKQTAWVANERKDDLIKVSNNFDFLLAQTRQAGVGSMGTHGFLIYDPLWLFPVSNNGGGPGEADYLRQLVPLLDKISAESVRAVGKFRVITVTPAVAGRSSWERLISAWPLNSSEIKRKLIADSGVSTDLSVQPRLVFYDDAGKLVEELNLAHSFSAQKRLVALLQALQVEDPPRCPIELRNALKQGVWVVPKGQSSRKLKNILNLLQKNCPYRISVDSRIADLTITTKSKGQNLSLTELLELLPEVLDLYWRKVGNAYHLAISVGDPRRDVLRKGTQNFDSLVIKVLTHLQELGVVDSSVPVSRIVGAKGDLGMASESIVNAIVEAYTECGVDACKFGKILVAARENGGYQVSYEYAISSVYNGPGFSFTTFVNSR